MGTDRVRLDDDAAAILDRMAGDSGASKTALASEAIRRYRSDDKLDRIREMLREFREDVTPTLTDLERSLVEEMCNDEGAAEAYNLYEKLVSKAEERTNEAYSEVADFMRIVEQMERMEEQLDEATAEQSGTGPERRGP